jgi:hypothetical protein
LKIIAAALVCLLSAGDSAFAQQAATPQAATPQAASAQATPAQTTPSAPPPPNTLLDGTAVKLRLAENLTSATAKAGQQVSFEVTEDVSVQGVVVLPKGAQALATVTDASPKKSMGRGGKLDVNVDSARLIDGEKVQLRAVQDAKGGGHVGAMTGAMVATAVVFFPAAPLFLFIHGKDIVIPKGTEVTAFVQGDTRLDMAKMVPPPPLGDPTAAPAGAATPSMASLSVDSTTPGADIEVDGAFVGNTPSTVSVTPGQHTIAVRKKGYADWTRTMNVSGSNIHLSADLEHTP